MFFTLLILVLVDLPSSQSYRSLARANCLLSTESRMEREVPAFVFNPSPSITIWKKKVDLHARAMSSRFCCSCSHSCAAPNPTAISACRSTAERRWFWGAPRMPTLFTNSTRSIWDFDLGTNGGSETRMPLEDWKLVKNDWKVENRPQVSDLRECHSIIHTQINHKVCWLPVFLEALSLPPPFSRSFS